MKELKRLKTEKAIVRNARTGGTGRLEVEGERHVVVSLVDHPHETLWEIWPLAECRVDGAGAKP